MSEIEAPATARVGEATPVRVRVSTSEASGTAVVTRLFEGTRELAHATVVSPGPGLEAVADMRVTPAHPGLAVWTARVDSLAGETSTADNARQVAIEYAMYSSCWLRVRYVATAM